MHLFDAEAGGLNLLFENKNIQQFSSDIENIKHEFTSKPNPPFPPKHVPFLNQILLSSEQSTAIINYDCSAVNYAGI